MKKVDINFVRPRSTQWSSLKIVFAALTLIATSSIAFRQRVQLNNVSAEHEFVTNQISKINSHLFEINAIANKTPDALVPVFHNLNAPWTIWFEQLEGLSNPNIQFETIDLNPTEQLALLSGHAKNANQLSDLMTQLEQTSHYRHVLPATITTDEHGYLLFVLRAEMVSPP